MREIAPITVADRIREAMAGAGLTIDAFAERLGEKPQRVKDVLRGKQRAPEAMLAALASQPGVDIVYVLTGETAKLRDALSQVRASSEIAARYGKTDAEKATLQADIFNALRASQPSAEDQALLELYHRADAVVRPAILAAATALAGGAAPHAQSPPAKKPPKPAPRTRKPKN